MPFYLYTHYLNKESFLCFFLMLVFFLFFCYCCSLFGIRHGIYCACLCAPVYLYKILSFFLCVCLFVPAVCMFILFLLHCFLLNFNINNNIILFIFVLLQHFPEKKQNISHSLQSSCIPFYFLIIFLFSVFFFLCE